MNQLSQSASFVAQARVLKETISGEIKYWYSAAARAYI
jgi:hypothetical protein